MNSEPQSNLTEESAPPNAPVAATRRARRRAATIGSLAATTNPIKQELQEKALQVEPSKTAEEKAFEALAQPAEIGQQPVMLVDGPQVTMEQVAKFLKDNNLVVTDAMSKTVDNQPVTMAIEDVPIASSQSEYGRKTPLQQLKEVFHGDDSATSMRTSREPMAVPVSEEEDMCILQADLRYDYVIVACEDNPLFGGRNDRDPEFYRSIGYQRVNYSLDETRQVHLRIFDPGKGEDTLQPVRKGTLLMCRLKGISAKMREEERRKNDPHMHRPEDTDQRTTINGQFYEAPDPVTFKNIGAMLPDKAGDPGIQDAWDRLNKDAGAGDLLNKVVDRALATSNLAD